MRRKRKGGGQDKWRERERRENEYKQYEDKEEIG